jgi:hypothetical protein
MGLSILLLGPPWVLVQTLSQPQWLFEGPGKMSLQPLRSAQPILLAWAHLFK